jgi:carboxyl-terminal processing protease
MRSSPALLALTLGAGALVAAPRPAGPPALPPAERAALRAEARRFARQLLALTDQVAEQYVRPVPREELLHSALAGLYQAARMPVPPGLGARLRQAASAVAGPARPASAPGPAAGDLVDPLGPFTPIVRRAREEVGRAEALRGQSALLVCCQAMARSLDPHSGVVTAEEPQRAMGLDRECEGVGLEVNDHHGAGPFTVETVLLGGPAQRAGLRPGDVLTHLDGKPIRSAPPQLLRAIQTRRVTDEVPPLTPGEGPSHPAGPARPVRLTFRRAGSAPRTAELYRDTFRPETVLGVARRGGNAWDYFAGPKKGLAHVRLSALGRGTADELRGVLTGLAEQGLRGLVLDLRWCPGGYLNEAVDVADLFLGEGVIATVKSRSGKDVVYRGTDGGKFRTFPVVVLVNGETSGGAELIAAALQDHRRATVVGQRTLGKASIQTPLPLGLRGVGFKLTTGTFVRPAGKNLHRPPHGKPADDWGVRPDPDGDFRVSPELSRRLRAWWLLHSLRPTDSSERLPLDDPHADPQRQAALEVLAALVEKKS